ncbi:MAG: right-handed parallel beta-helix repeat-containing protein [Bdellovibrionota bacterium]
MILTGDVKLKGNRKFKSVVTPLDFNKPIITIRGQNSLSNLKIIDGLIGVKVEADALVKIHNCKILNNINDGVLADAPLEGEAPATINIVNSLISKNGDGVDLEASRGSIRNSRLCNQLDDAIDYDGNSNFSVYNNTICNNRDDGIEIRLASSTTGIIKGNRIFGNGEDGIEVIDTSEVNTNNLILIRRNKVFRNARYGISGVDHDLEDAIQGNIVDEILAKRNRIRKNGIAQIIGIE